MPHIHYSVLTQWTEVRGNGAKSELECTLYFYVSDTWVVTEYEQ